MLDENPESVRCHSGSRFLLAVFGKHPAWSDHIDDIGVDTPSLAEFKRRLYTEGIRINLDAGNWERLPEDRKLASWNHRLFITGPKGMLLARLWATSDGRGRRAYPMVSAIHLPTTRPPENLGPLFDVLEEVRTGCMNAETQDEVRQTARQGKTALQYAVTRLSPLPPDGPAVSQREAFISLHGHEELHRVLHLMSSDLTDYAPGTKRSLDLPPKRFRVGLFSGDPESQLLSWHSFFKPHLRPDILWTAAHPIDEPWADIVIGEMDTSCVYSLRTNSLEDPVISSIPFSIPPEKSEIFSKTLTSFVIPPYELPSIYDKDHNEKSNSFISRWFGK